MAEPKVWIRRLLFVVLAIAVLWTATVLWLGSVGSSRLETQLEQIRDAGEPLTLAELVPPPVPEAENAAPLFLEAFALVKGEPIEWWEDGDVMSRYDLDPFSMDDTWYEKVAAWVESNEPALAKAREAIARPACRFDLEWEKGIEMYSPQIPGFMELSRVLTHEAILQTRAGDVDGAVATCADLVRLADIGLRDPLMIYVLVRAGLVDVALRTAQQVLAHGPAATGALENLLARLEALPREGELHRMFVGERTFGYDAFEQLRQDPSKVDQWIGYDESLGLGRDILFRLVPDTMLRLDGARYLALVSRAIELSSHPYREVTSAWGALGNDIRERPWYAVISGAACAAFPMVAKRWTRHHARTDLARLGLRLEIHARRFGGLPAVIADAGGPVMDPFRDAPFVLRTTGDGGWLVYSVGPDGNDDGGAPLDDDERGDLVWSRVSGH